MSYQTSSKRSPLFWLLIGDRKLVFFWHQSEARTAATVWNWSGKTLGAFHLGKKLGNFGGSKSGISDWLKVVPFGRKPPYVAVPYRGPGTGTNYEKRKWNTIFRSEIPTGKTGPPF